MPRAASKPKHQRLRPATAGAPVSGAAAISVFGDRDFRFSLDLRNVDQSRGLIRRRPAGKSRPHRMHPDARLPELAAKHLGYTSPLPGMALSLMPDSIGPCPEAQHRDGIAGKGVAEFRPGDV